MAKSKTKPADEKKYIVVFNNSELWVVGTKNDIMKDFYEDPEVYIESAELIKIYEIGTPVPFKFIQPQIQL